MNRRQKVGPWSFGHLPIVVKASPELSYSPMVVRLRDYSAPGWEDYALLAPHHLTLTRRPHKYPSRPPAPHRQLSVARDRRFGPWCSEHLPTVVRTHPEHPYRPLASSHEAEAWERDLFCPPVPVQSPVPVCLFTGPVKSSACHRRIQSAGDNKVIRAL